MIFHPSIGGAALNFKVVGGIEQPANPNENTIWVKTDQKIPSWAFSQDEPADKEEGLVWFQTGVAQTSFNALKKNTIVVQPSNAKQFISEEWQPVDFKLHRDGDWVSAGFSLYNYGNECEDATGGWSISYVWYNGYEYAEKGTDALTATCGKSASVKVAFSTQKAIDVTGYTKLRAVFSEVTDLTTQYNGEYGHAVGLRNSALPVGELGTGSHLMSWYFTNAYALSTQQDPTEHSLEVSLDGLSGLFYVCVVFGCCSCSCKYIVLE